MKEEVVCKGRNGFFNFGSIDIWATENMAWAEFFSTRIGKEAPIKFRGNPDDLIAIFSEVIDELKKATDNKPYGAKTIFGPDGEIDNYVFFHTQAEKDAYAQGILDGAGWLECEIEDVEEE